MKRHWATSSLLVLSTCLVAFLVDDLSAVIDLSGALGGGTTGLVLPCLAWQNCGLRTQERSWRALITWKGLLTILASLLTVFLTTITAYSWVVPEDRPPSVGECGVNNITSSFMDLSFER